MYSFPLPGLPSFLFHTYPNPSPSRPKTQSPGKTPQVVPFHTSGGAVDIDCGVNVQYRGPSQLGCLLYWEAFLDIDCHLHEGSDFFLIRHLERCLPHSKQWINIC